MIQRSVFVFRELFSSYKISFIVFLCSLFAVVLGGALYAVNSAVDEYVGKTFPSTIPAGIIKVSPESGEPQVSLFGLDFGSQGRRLTEKDFAAVKAIRGVKNIFPVVGVTVPSQAAISFMGAAYATDLVCIGVPIQFVEKDIAGEKYKALWKNPGERVPVLVPQSLIRAYNDVLSGTNGLPRISEKNAPGIKFRIIFGRSSVKEYNDTVARDAVVAGFTDRIDAMGLVIPYSSAIEMNRKFIENYRPDFLYFYIQSESQESMPFIKEKISRLGLAVTSERDVSKQIASLREKVSLATGTVLLMIVVLASVSISFSSMIAAMTRIEYYKILRIAGATRFFIMILATVKFLAIGIFASAAGVLILNHMTFKIVEPLGLKAAVFPYAVMLKVFLVGAVIPAISSIPAVVKIFFYSMNTD